MTSKLLYRVVPHNGGVVFADPERAAYIAKIHEAINSSRTWGDFKAAMPPEEYFDIVSAYEDQDEAIPDPSMAFSSENVPGWSDGDYPPWLQKEMETILPKSILEQFGERQSTFLNGDFWLIPENNMADVCAALEAQGWQLELAQNLKFH